MYVHLQLSQNWDCFDVSPFIMVKKKIRTLQSPLLMFGEANNLKQACGLHSSQASLELDQD